MGYFKVRYDSRVIIYERKMFTRLATDMNLVHQSHSAESHFPHQNLAVIFRSVSQSVSQAVRAIKKVLKIADILHSRAKRLAHSLPVVKMCKSCHRFRFIRHEWNPTRLESLRRLSFPKRRKNDADAKSFRSLSKVANVVESLRRKRQRDVEEVHLGPAL